MSDPPFWYWTNTSTGRFTVTDLLEPCPPHDLLCHIRFDDGPLVLPADFLLHAAIEYKGKPQDVTCNTSGLHVVSDRVRTLIETHAPGNCVFIPMQLFERGEPSALKYWTFQAKSIDCADHAQSGKLRHGTIMDPVIVENRVPPDTSVFRICNGCGSVYIRDSLRRVFVSEKVTGSVYCQPWAPPDIHRPDNH